MDRRTIGKQFRGPSLISPSEKETEKERERELPYPIRWNLFPLLVVEPAKRFATHNNDLPVTYCPCILPWDAALRPSFWIQWSISVTYRSTKMDFIQSLLRSFNWISFVCKTSVDSVANTNSRNDIIRLKSISYSCGVFHWIPFHLEGSIVLVSEKNYCIGFFPQ